MFDYIVIGCGFSGAVLAERIANVLNKRVLIIEKRNHIAGNCYDFFGRNGILVHKYGPHIFHTKKKHVWEYISQFTDWILYQHQVLAFIDGRKVPVPFNINSLHALFPSCLAKRIEEKLIKAFGYGRSIPVLRLSVTFLVISCIMTVDL